MVTPARRPLVRRSLELNTPVKQEESCMDMEETFTASPFDLANCSPVQEDCHVWNDQCISVCCQSFPDLCKNVKKKPVLVDSSTQTIDVTALDHNYFYNKRTRDASVQHNTTEFSAESISGDMDCKFYTGLSLAVFTTLISTLSKFGRQLPYKMDIPDLILLVIIRLRIALTFRDIGRRFSISHQLPSNIFNSWIDIMAKELSPCITWLPRETIRKSLPSSFQTSYPKTTCIIDCSEIFIQRPFSLKARAQTWSTNKSHNTAKFLIAIAPNGFIMYISPLYGGRASDNFITKNCGFLNNLLPGDEIMADRGFTISEELYARRVKLNIPAFMKGRSQLSEAETIESRRIAAQRIHVERAIMRLKSYRISNTTLGIKTLKKGNQTLQVIGVLCNLRQPLIKKYVLDID